MPTTCDRRRTGYGSLGAKDSGVLSQHSAVVRPERHSPQAVGCLTEESLLRFAQHGRAHHAFGIHAAQGDRPKGVQYIVVTTSTLSPAYQLELQLVTKRGGQFHIVLERNQAILAKRVRHLG